MDIELTNAVHNLMYMKYTPEKPLKQSKRIKRQIKKIIEPKECQLCHTKTSPLWRKLPEYTCVCNKCGLKYKRK